MARSYYTKRKHRSSGRHHHRHGRSMLLPIILLGIAILLVGGAGAWYLKLRPQLTLWRDELTLKIGQEFDTDSLIYELKNAEPSAVQVDTGDLNTDRAGSYIVSYRVEDRSVPEALQTLLAPFEQETLYVTVRVQDPPEAETITSEGADPDSVNSAEGAEMADGTDTAAADESPADTEGSMSASETAEASEVSGKDGAGQAETPDTGKDGTDEQNHPDAAGADPKAAEPGSDKEAPVISGVHDTAVSYGSGFDVMEGVSAADDRDPEPSLTADVTEIDSDTYGKVHIIYTATDASGNTATAERDVIVCEQVARTDGYAYPVHWDLAGVEGQPYLVAVNRTQNAVTVFEQDANGQYTTPVKAFVCSCGYRTPSGYYITKERYRWRYLFEDSWGQYATRIIDHILFHSVPYEHEDPSTLEYDEYNLLGTEASLGCIRLAVQDVKWIYDNCPDGFPCVIYDDELTPGPLGKPEPLTIDTSDTRRGWDPTDPDPANPWNS